MLSSINNFQNNTQITAGDQRSTSSPWGLLWLSLLPLELFSCREETGSPLLKIRADLPKGKAHSSPGRWSWVPCRGAVVYQQKNRGGCGQEGRPGAGNCLPTPPPRGPSMAWHVWFAGPSSVFFFFFFKFKFTTTLYILFLLLEVKFLTSLARERNGRARN